jgi:hypothetical protein
MKSAPKILSKELIDIICPEHDRTSCSDADISNGGYEIKEIKFQGVTISREWKYCPRCNRCFLLDHIGYDMNLFHDIQIVPKVEINLIQPKVKIIEEDTCPIETY